MNKVVKKSAKKTTKKVATAKSSKDYLGLVF
jgi:hypothetical protein